MGVGEERWVGRSKEGRFGQTREISRSRKGHISAVPFSQHLPLTENLLVFVSLAYQVLPFPQSLTKPSSRTKGSFFCLPQHGTYAPSMVLTSFYLQWKSLTRLFPQLGLPFLNDRAVSYSSLYPLPLPVPNKIAHKKLLYVQKKCMFHWIEWELK